MMMASFSVCLIMVFYWISYIFLKSKKAFERIKYVGYEVAESDEWYSKKMLRDKTARREYFSVERNKRQRGDLYIVQIMDEEMKPNDPRLS